jgi:starch-binding outer membrane protein, SusD/RagB family
MKNSLLAAVLGTACFGLASCQDFLSSTEATKDPNNPTRATIDQSFVAVQSNGFALLEGAVPHDVCMWLQQCGGVGGRTFEEQGAYQIQPGDVSGDFTGIYVGGGLVDIRRVQEAADAAGDKFYAGVARVWEAVFVSFAADVWGDIPYREAIGSVATPKFDDQMQVYADLQTLLDRAITDLESNTGVGPGVADLVFRDKSAAQQRKAWVEVAHTLKARLYLHTVEKLGAAQYAKALAEAQKGISSPDNDFKSLHSTATSERNMWVQFSNTSFGPDIVAGAFLTNLMNAQNDPRRAEYFGKNSKGGYGGYDVTTGNAADASLISPLTGSGRNGDGSFRQPLITYAENQLIIAEASLQAGNTAAALAAYNAERASFSLPAATSVTLATVMTEKYIALFQNVEAWADYKRTCLPALKPAAGETEIPGRFYYGQSEQNANPNTPSAGDQLAKNGFRNTNDPAACK